MEKFALIVVILAKQQKPYFKAHPATIFTDMPLHYTLHKLDASGRMMKNVIELGVYKV